jgi:hypothetical protein
VNLDENELCVFHCIIHQQYLCAKSIDLTHVISKAENYINFIKSRACNHRQFHQCPEDIQVEYGDLIYFCEVRWLRMEKKFEAVLRSQE